MPGLEHGFKRAVTGIVAGFAVSAIFKEIATLYGYHPFLLIFFTLSIVAIIDLLSKMTYWSLYYLIGWLLGLILLGFLLSWWEFAIYFFIGLFILFKKLGMFQQL
jgi:hypothetical protein